MVAILNSARLATGQVGHALRAEAPGTIHRRNRQRSRGAGLPAVRRLVPCTVATFGSWASRHRFGTICKTQGRRHSQGAGSLILTIDGLQPEKGHETFEALIDRFEATEDPIRHGMATVMLSFLAGLFVGEEAYELDFLHSSRSSHKRERGHLGARADRMGLPRPSIPRPGDPRCPPPNSSYPS